MFDDDETSDESDNCSGKSCVLSEDVDVVLLQLVLAGSAHLNLEIRRLMSHHQG